jgi:putative membrane protein
MPVAVPALLLLALSAGPTSAHGPVAVQPEALWVSWSFDPWVLIPLAVAHWLYGRGVLRLWAQAGQGRGVSRANVLSFAAGEVALVVALVSPLDALGGTLLTAHMAQHALLVAVAPPLLLLGRPGAAFAWALPGRRRKRLLASTAWRWAARLGRALARPLPAAALHGLALWLWHAPALFEAALEYPWLHTLEHVTFFGTALLFWRAVLDAGPLRRMGPALGAALATLVHGGLLAALITMAPHPFYAWYGGRSLLWGLDALEDQQLGGLLMWVPMGMVYLGACLGLAWRLVEGEERRSSRAPPGFAAEGPSAQGVAGGRLLGLWLLLSVLAAPASVLAQGTQPGAAQGGEPQQGGTVQAGAGTKGDVTPGASGPQSEGDLAGIEPAEAGFRIRPPSDPFHGPGQLPIQRPDRLRCDVIQDAAAKRQCESRASRPQGGTDGG